MRTLAVEVVAEGVEAFALGRAIGFGGSMASSKSVEALVAAVWVGRPVDALVADTQLATTRLSRSAGDAA